MKRNFNNPTNKRIGQAGPGFRPGQGTLDRASYPLDDREKELENEINSPTIPAVYKRVQTIDSEEAPPRGSVGSGSHEPYKEGREHYDGVSTGLDTWDEPGEMTETNQRMKYVQSGVDSEDEPFRANETTNEY